MKISKSYFDTYGEYRFEYENNSKTLYIWRDEQLESTIDCPIEDLASFINSVLLLEDKDNG